MTPGHRLLIVDDEAAQLRALCQVLRTKGYVSVGHTRASEALIALRESAFDVLITDFSMPEMDGIALVRAAREIDADLVGIVMTGTRTVDSIAAAAMSTDVDYILKPVELSAILPRLSRALALRSLRRENAALSQRLAQQLQEQAATNSELQAANRELAAFTHSVSHDLRAPLRTINALARVLRDKLALNVPVEAGELLDRISTKTREMGQLIEDLLRLSHLSVQPLAKRPVDVMHLATEVLVELRAQEPERDVATVVGKLPEVPADRALLRQVFVNLQANALKFTRHVEQPIIQIDGWQEKDACVYSIRDNGAGFDMQYADKLFGICQRLHTVDEFEGTGIGLSIVQRIIERHGGRIWAEGSVGKGATFTFRLPM